MRAPSYPMGWAPPPPPPTRPDRGVIRILVILGVIAATFWVASRWGILAVGLVVLAVLTFKNSPRRGLTALFGVAVVMLALTVTGPTLPTPKVERVTKAKADQATGALAELQDRAADVYVQIRKGGSR